jgi:outer membrane receptor protein involved in Fe transport
MRNLLLVAMVLGLTPWATAQTQGHVFENKPDGTTEPLVGANVYWLNTTIGTVTDIKGHFALSAIDETSQLVVSYVGYVADTIDTKGKSHFQVVLNSSQVLDDVVVQGSKATTVINTLEGINTITMTEDELFKAACCNLSESFETNPSVDVSFTDAVTGTKQIQMLGLSGPNTMIGIENMPGIRGLSSNVGLSFIPGTWIQSIQVTKGVGSVVNGYESIAGQINVEMKKPQDSEKLFLNIYGNQSGRTEMNLNFTKLVGEKWGTTVLLHGSARPYEHDQNTDGFLDFPTTSQLNFVNRWLYKGTGNVMGQFGVKVMTDHKLGGQVDYDADEDRGTMNAYGLEINTKRYEAWGKLGYLNKAKPYQSIGLQVSATRHEQEAYFGLTDYDATQNTLYGNLIYQSIIGTTQHKFKTGMSLLYEQYDEQLTIGDFAREEVVPGAFVEYTYTFLDKFTMIAGLRADHNNLFGTFITPRLHTRYAIAENTTLRASVGRGQRTANVLAENISLLATSRQIRFANQQSEKGYGFEPNSAWNFGLNLTQDLRINYRPATLQVDFYRTSFKDQVVIDLDTPGEVTFMGLTGQSYSNSLQVELNYELARRFDVRLAYRWIDVQTDYAAGLNSKPLIAKNRAFINLAYKTKNRWAFDLTTQWVGAQRLPNTSSSPEAYQLASYSPDYALMNAQITKSFDKGWDVYFGGENLGNYKQDNPIVSVNEPFGQYFDTSMIYAPIFGRMIYAGVRFKIE